MSPPQVPPTPDNIPQAAKELDALSRRLEINFKSLVEQLSRRQKLEKVDPDIWENAMLMAMMKVFLRRALQMDLSDRDIMHNVQIMLVHCMVEMGLIPPPEGMVVTPRKD